jgi:acylpyruvate hydrolase
MKILCVGQNYAKHAAEMGSSSPDAPIWFWKPESAIVRSGEAIRLPPAIGEVHHEVEWAIRIGANGKPDAMTIAVDVTARDMQTAAKKAGRPWTQAKGYDTFLPLGTWVPFEPGPHAMRLSINDDLRQDGTTADMSWGIDALLAHAAKWTTLYSGDIVLTGTPAGVGAIETGDEIEVELVGKVAASFTVK